MAFPIIPRARSGASGYPTSLYVGELAVNTKDGELYLGADNGVVKLAVPGAAGTTATQFTGNGSATDFAPILGWTSTSAAAYLVSVGGIDQRAGVDYTIGSSNGGTLQLATAPANGVPIQVRAITQGIGGGSGDGNATKLQGVDIAGIAPSTGEVLAYNGTAWAPAAGGSGNATQLQSRDIATTAPNDGQVLAWNATTSKWEPQGGGGTITFNTVGTHYWRVPAGVRYAMVDIIPGKGDDGGNGYTGQDGSCDEFGNPVDGADGADGVEGANGQSVIFNGTTYAGGQGGKKGYGGGGGGGACIGAANPGRTGRGPGGGGGGGPGNSGPPLDYGQGGGTYIPGGTATSSAGAQSNDGISGFGGNGGSIGNAYGSGGGGGGQNDVNDGGSGGGGGGGACEGSGYSGGLGGLGGAGRIGFSANQAHFAHLFTAGSLEAITITSGAGTASITITW